MQGRHPHVPALPPSVTGTPCRRELIAFREDLDLTLIEVTHALNEAAAHADRVIILAGGRIVAEGPVGALVSRPLDREVARGILATVAQPDGRPQ